MPTVGTNVDVAVGVPGPGVAVGVALGVPVGEVARECGYASESAFSAMFKATMGASPRQFRTSTGTVAGPEPAAGTIAA